MAVKGLMSSCLRSGTGGDRDPRMLAGGGVCGGGGGCGAVNLIC